MGKLVGSFFTSSGVSTQSIASTGERESEWRAGEIGTVGMLDVREGAGTDGIGGPDVWHNKGVEAGGPRLETPSVGRDREAAGSEAGGGIGRTG